MRLEIILYASEACATQTVLVAVRYLGELELGVLSGGWIVRPSVAPALVCAFPSSPPLSVSTLRSSRLSRHRRGVHEPLALRNTHALAEATDHVLNPTLPVVRRRRTRRPLALLDSVCADLEVLQAALMDLGLGVGAQGEVGLVVLAALDAVLLSAMLQAWFLLFRLRMKWDARVL